MAVPTGVAAVPPAVPPEEPLHSGLPDADWYPDPWDSTRLRWWDGQSWTSLNAPQPERTLPFPVAVMSLVGFVGLMVAISLTIGIVAAIAQDSIDSLPGWFVVIVSGLLLYGPMVAWMRYVSRRWGSGSVRLDLGLRFAPEDAAWGPAALLSGWVMAIVVGIGAAIVGLPAGSNTTGIGALDDPATIVTVVILAVVVAPVVEEMFFRGLVLRSLRSRLNVPLSLMIQGVAFGSAHFSLGLGIGNLTLVATLSGIGVMYGLVAWHTRRLGASMLAHALQNAMAITLTLLLA